MDTSQLNNAITGILSGGLLMFLFFTGIAIIWVKILAWAITSTVLNTIDHHKSKNRLQEWQNKMK